MRSKIIDRSSQVAPLRDDGDGEQIQGARFGDRRLTAAGLPRDRPSGVYARRRGGEPVRAVDIWAEGDPVILQPEGVLIRWPSREPLPELGQPVEGRSVHVDRADWKAAIKVLLCGNVLERCEAACQLPPRIVRVFYSASHANNMERAWRNLCPDMKAHVANVLQRNVPVSCNLIFKMSRARTPEAQWAIWRAAP